MQKEPTVLNAKVRRAAKRVGLRARKSRYRTGTTDNRGKFMLIDPYRNRILCGERFDLEPEAIIAFCKKFRPIEVSQSIAARTSVGIVPRQILKDIPRPPNSASRDD